MAHALPAEAGEDVVIARNGKPVARLVPIVDATPLAAVHGALRGRVLPWHHRVPFDRLLVAQALAENAAVVSREEALTPYGVFLVW